MPAFTQTCHNCFGANFPTMVLATSLAVFSGEIESAAAEIVSVNGADAVLNRYDVSAETTWLGLGKQQSADLSLPHLNEQAFCGLRPAAAGRSYLFLVIGPPSENPFLWACVPLP